MTAAIARVAVATSKPIGRMTPRAACGARPIPPRLAHYVYDKAGRKIAVDVNGFGWVTEYRYDAADWLAATVRYGNAANGAALALLADPPNSNPEMAAVRPAASASDIFELEDLRRRRMGDPGHCRRRSRSSPMTMTRRAG